MCLKLVVLEQIRLRVLLFMISLVDSEYSFKNENPEFT